MEHANAAAEATALKAELANTRAAHTNEVEQMTAVLRTTLAGGCRV